MRERLEEQAVIFISILKWISLAVIIGVIVGFSTSFFLNALHWSIDLSESFQYTIYFIPLVFLLNTLLSKKLAPKSKGHGTEKVIEAVHKNYGKIDILVVPVKLVTTVLTIAFGGSAGKEGPAGQIGAGLASGFSDLFKLKPEDRKKLVICGISAGFGAVFGTPVSGAIFGVEVLFVGAVMYDVMLPSFISGIIAYHICLWMGISYFNPVNSFIPTFSESFFLIIVLGGIVFGLISFFFIETFTTVEKFVKQIKLNDYVKNLFGGILIVGLVFVFSAKYSGLGTGVIEGIFAGSVQVNWNDFLLKILFTVVTLSIGGSGGVVTPIFFIGATAGSLFGTLMGVDNVTFAAIGMVSMLSATANTPIAASIMALEMFGSSIAPYAAISCIISFLMTGHRSIFPSQILSFQKTNTIQVDNMGVQMNQVESHVKYKERYKLYRFWKLLKK